MRILIVSTARSGSTTLTNAIASELKLNQLMEPFNPGIDYNLYNPIQKNIILKTLIHHHKDFDEIIELSKTFDKTILLSRRDNIAAWESECNGIGKRQKVKERNGYYNGFHLWHEPYVHNPELLNEDYKSVVTGRMNLILNLHKTMGIPMVWYEDLFSNDIELARKTYQNMGLDVNYDNVYTYMNPTKKYRKDNHTLI